MSRVPTVLIVDDSRFARHMIRKLIVHAFPDWTIIEAGNGQEALEKATGVPIDVMTIDFNMPGIDGLTLATTLRTRYPAARITLVTANVQESVRRRAAAAGVQFLAKPLSEDDRAAFLACVCGERPWSI